MQEIGIFKINTVVGGYLNSDEYNIEEITKKYNSLLLKYTSVNIISIVERLDGRIAVYYKYER